MRIAAPNFTQAPNQLFDEWLPLLGFAELKVLMVIIRKTFGWHKIRDRISLSQLETITGLERRHVSKAIKTLIEKCLITKFVEGAVGSQSTYYELVVEEDSNNSYQCPKDTPGGVLKTPTKETITKENISPIVPKGDTPSRKSKREEKKETAPRVFISNTQEEDLLRRLQGSQDKLKKCYDKLSSWKIGKEIFGGKNDYKAIVDWVIDSVERENIKKPQEDDLELIKKLREYVDIKKIKGIVFGHNYVEFEGVYDGHYKVGDSGFKEKIENRLRKMGISIPW